MLKDELLELFKTNQWSLSMCLAFHLTKIKVLILEAMQSITAKHWSDCIDLVKGIEVDYWASDIARDEMPEPVVIKSGFR